jgi:hypothetical protein
MYTGLSSSRALSDVRYSEYSPKLTVQSNNLKLTLCSHS